MSWQIGSLVVLVCALGGGIFWYEKSKPPSQIVALVAVLAALAVAGRIVLAPIPNVVATTDVVFFAGYALGPAPGFAVGALGGLVSNFWLGQGAWTPWQMVGWGMTGIAGGIFWWMTRGNAGRLKLAIACGLAGLVFGAWMNLQSMVSYGGDMSLERYLALEARAIPFDLAHITGNVIFALAAGPAMVAALRRFRERFEWQAVVPAVSMLVLCVIVGGIALKPDLASAESSRVTQAKDWLSAQVNPNGGFGIEPGDASSLEMTTWAMFGLGKTGKDIEKVKSANGSTPVDYLRNNRGNIDHASILAKAILALKAVNANPRSLGGVDLVKKLQQKVKDNPTSGGRINTAAFTIMALRVVKVDRSEVDDTERWICKSQKNDGGWGISADAKSDVDSTGAALQVVGGTGFKGNAIGYLRAEQTNNGGFGNGFGGTNSQSTSLAIQGMMGADYAVSNMNNGGNTALDYLERHQKDAGYIAYDGSSGSASSVWVTAQALPSMAEKNYFGGSPRDCNDFVPVETPVDTTPPSSGGTPAVTTPPTYVPPSSSGSTSSGSGSSGPGSGSTSGSGSGNGSGSGSGFNGSGTGSGTDPGTIDTTPSIVDPVIPVVPPADLVAASAAGPEPSPIVALAIMLAVTGMLIGGTLWLARRFSW